MYIPEVFANKDKISIIEFMKAYSFGTLVSGDSKRCMATHLPFVIEERKGNLVLTTHMAAANAQTSQIGKTELLAIFTEPHAYISPANYKHHQNVPTWNYAAVHVYGHGRVLSGEAEVVSALEKMIDTYDTDYKQQWKSISPKYKAALAKEIVAFELIAHEIQAVNKLSQNKSRKDQETIVASLKTHGDELAKTIAGMMEKNFKSEN